MKKTDQSIRYLTAAMLTFLTLPSLATASNIDRSASHFKALAKQAIGPVEMPIILQHQVRGTVTDSNQEPLIGASVIVKGTGQGAATNANGEFSISVKDPSDILIIQYVGFETKEVVAGSSPLAIILIEDSELLGEAVVVGYGTQKKVNLTGAIATVDAKQLESRPITNVASALQGTMSGVTVTSTSGQPGRDGGTIRVRGIGTLNNSNPMVVVDGVVSSMSNINPEDIATISVLKDAASAAIYGSRAANGVVLITTKQGKKGSTNINYNAYVGKQQTTSLPDYLPSWQAASLYNQALINEGKTVRYSDEEITKFKDGSDPFNYPNTDWLGLFYNGSGVQQNHYLDVSGGSDNSQYLFSLGMFDQEGLVKGTNNKRYTSRMNLTSQVKSNLKVNANLAYSNGTLKEGSNPYTGDFSQLIRQINRISPMVPYKDKFGNYGYISDGSPMAWLEQGGSNRETAHNLFGTAGADWEPVTGLHLRPSLSYVLTNNQNKKFIKDIQYFDPNTGNPSKYQGPNSLTDVNATKSVTSYQLVADYAKSFALHNFKLLGGYSQEYTKYQRNEGYRKGFLNNNLGELDAGPIDGQSAKGYAYELALQSVFGRLNYDLDGKYLFEANLRYDGSSRFAKENRWGVFPSFSAGWNLDREAFFEPLKATVSNLKLRASWGQLGNQITSSSETSNSFYPYIPGISSGQNYIFGGSSPIISAGIAPVNGANGEIMWETSTEYGAGIDATFLDGRFNLTVDYFNKLTDNILLNVPVGNAYGLTAPVQNAGAVRNKGFEFVLGYNEQFGDFGVHASANAAFIKNEVTDLHETGPIIEGGRFKEVGYPINSFYGYISEGIFQSQAEVDAHAKQSGGVISAGDLKYKDLNGDGVIDGQDRTYLGSFFPKVAYGFNLGGNWKSLDLTLFFQGAGGVKNYVHGIMLGQVNSSTGKPTSALLDTWTPENTDASMPRIWSGYKQNDPGTNVSSFWVRDASYLRLKNVQLGYNLPESTLASIGIKKARFYYSGQNVLTFTKFYDWVDPEAPAGDNGYTYPQVKVHTIGLNVTF